MRSFFEDYPKVPITIDGRVVNYTDYFKFVDVNELFLRNFNDYEIYEISDGQRPDNVSYNLYETTNFAWTFFVVNDRLKNGMKEWPLSSTALDDYITNTYEPYGVCEMLPDNISFATGIPKPYTKLNGLDLTHEHLRVYRVDSINSTSYSKIEKYDSLRWQLWLTETKDPGFFVEPDDLGNNEIAIILVNPYTPGTDEYDEVEASNLAWLYNTAETWYEDFYSGFTFTDENIQAEIESKMVFAVNEFHQLAQNAPYYRYNAVTGKRLGHTLAMMTQSGVPFTYLEHEIAMNDAKKQIKVLREDVIYEFEARFLDALNETTRLELE
jgi:hypothetical protein